MRAAIIIFIFITLCLISGQELYFRVIGCAGGSLMFKCMISNQREIEEQRKGNNFCRDENCKVGISTELQRRWVYNGSFALYDDGNSRFFTVFIRNLSREDDGDYTCGNNQKWSRDVGLVVKKESCWTSVIRDKFVGQTITFHCKYDHFKTHTKVFYRLKEGPVHVLNSSQSSEEKIILSDSHQDHFTVTIRNISADDEGVYLCGVEKYGSDPSITHITFIKEIQLNVYSRITSVQVQAYSSKSVFITCKFPQRFKGNKKFIQKDSKIPVDEQNQWVHHGKFHMYDDSSEGLLKVFISNLTAADEGTYRCGVNITDDDLITDVKLTVNQDDHFRASSKASADIGESVNLTCDFPEKHGETFKHICRENEQKICESISSSEQKRFEFSVSTAGVFTVIISNVSERDAGVYWCGAETRDTHLTSVSLTNQHQLTLTKSTNTTWVSNRTEHFSSTESTNTTWVSNRTEHSSSTAVTREASVGGSVSISCKFFRNHTRFFCRGDQPNICVRDGVRVSSNTRTNGRFSLTDETSAGVFTVNITDLTEEDSGKYWCAEESSGSFVFTEVHLHVIGETTTSDTERETSQDKEKSETTKSDTERETSQEISEMTSSETERETSQDKEKYEQNKKETSQYKEKSGDLSKSDTDRETSQDKEKSSSFVIVAVSVGLILLAVCLVLVLLKIKYNRKHGIISSSDRRETGDRDMAQEEIQDSDHLYSTVQLNTILSDSQNPLYSTVQLPTNPSDLQNPLNSTGQLPIILSDSQNPLYSTVQLPTNPSDSQNTLNSTGQLPTIPSDGPLYSAVSFQKHEESLSDATVTISNNEIHSDYASVKHSITNITV